MANLLLKRLTGGQSPCRLAPDAVAALQAYDFPGNVRELRNLLQHAVLSCRDGTIGAAALGVTERTLYRKLKQHGLGKN